MSKPNTYKQDCQKIEQAINYITQNFRRQPELDEVAMQVGVSPFYFQKIFKEWAGISPKKFLQYITLEHAKPLLRSNANLLETSYEVGLSGSSRLHDLFVTCEAVSPGQYKQEGDGLEIRYGLHDSPFGMAFIAVSPKGICELDYPGNAEESLEKLHRKWPRARLIHDMHLTSSYIQKVFGFIIDGSLPAEKISLHLKGTNFQIKVWQALLNIPMGGISSYSDIASEVGSPAAVRAVGSAVGDNPIAYLIPCHRVLRKSGDIGGYATGTPRKRVMLAVERIYADSDEDMARKTSSGG